MTDDERDAELRRELSRPLTAREITNAETYAEFAYITDPGHWCPACGEEPPGQPSCAECYDMEPATPEELASQRQDVSRMTPADLRDLAWLWKS